jgi:hypothetical protein
METVLPVIFCWCLIFRSLVSRRPPSAFGKRKKFTVFFAHNLLDVLFHTGNPLLSMFSSVRQEGTRQ